MSVVAVRTNSRSVSKSRRNQRAISCTAASRPVGAGVGANAGLGVDGGWKPSLRSEVGTGATMG